MIGDVSQKIANQFAANLSAKIATPSPPPLPESFPSPSPALRAASPQGGEAGIPATPIGGFLLLYWALVRALGRFFVRLGEALLRMAPLD